MKSILLLYLSLGTLALAQEPSPTPPPSVPPGPITFGWDEPVIDEDHGVPEGYHIYLDHGAAPLNTISNTYTVEGLGTGPHSIAVAASGPITITVPSSNNLGDTAPSTSVTLANGYHELSFVYRGGAWWRVDY